MDLYNTWIASKEPETVSSTSSVQTVQATPIVPVVLSTPVQTRNVVAVEDPTFRHIESLLAGRDLLYTVHNEREITNGRSGYHVSPTETYVILDAEFSDNITYTLPAASENHSLEVRVVNYREPLNTHILLPDGHKFQDVSGVANDLSKTTLTGVYSIIYLQRDQTWVVMHTGVKPQKKSVSRGGGGGGGLQGIQGIQGPAGGDGVISPYQYVTGSLANNRQIIPTASDMLNLGTNSTIAAGSLNGIVLDHSFIGAGIGNTTYSSHAFIGGGQGNTTTAGSLALYQFIGEGINNSTSGAHATVLNGDRNRALNTYSTVVNGLLNIVSGTQSIILNGNSNSILSTNSLIGPGGSNYINLGADYSVILSGQGNTCTTIKCCILTGQGNIAAGDYSTVLNGTFNVANSQFTVVCGSGNTSIDAHYAIVGGSGNYVSGNNLDGPVGSASSTCSSIIMGRNTNCINSIFMFINGFGNSATDVQNGSLQGTRNVSTTHYSYIAGQGNTSLAANFTFIGAGSTCLIDGNFSMVGVGQRNKITNLSSHGAILNGSDNFMDSSRSSFMGGSGNTMIGGTGSVLYGTRLLSEASPYSVLTGIRNVLYNSAAGSILGGSGNTINASDRSCIVGGMFNLIINSSNSFMGGGSGNTMNNGTYSGMVGGVSNNISTSSWGTISGGNNNKIDQSSSASIVGGTGGFINIGNNACIIGGVSNFISLSPSACIIGGNSHRIVDTSTNGFIGGGTGCTINNSEQSSITSGSENSVRNISYNAGIVAGLRNILDGAPNCFIAGGSSGNINDTQHSSIIGGEQNRIRNHADRSAIIGGTGSLIDIAKNSVILGGTGIGLTSTVYDNNVAACFGLRNYGPRQKNFRFLSLVATSVTLVPSDHIVIGALLQSITLPAAANLFPGQEFSVKCRGDDGTIAAPIEITITFAEASNVITRAGELDNQTTLTLAASAAYSSVSFFTIYYVGEQTVIGSRATWVVGHVTGKESLV